MPRTAPTYTGTPTYVIVSFRWIDANGQPGSSPVLTTLDRATVAAVENMADALGDMSNANLYDIVLEEHTAAAAASPSAAVEAPRESVKDILTQTQRDATTRQTQGIEVPAPLDSIFVEGTNTPDVENPLIVQLALAANALLPASFNPISYRFSERKGYNKGVKV